MIGECVCGAVSYEIEGSVDGLYQCHCTICQKQTGSSCQTGVFVDIERFNWLSGQDQITHFKKDNGYSTSFCSQCGATVPNIFSVTGDRYWVPAGTVVGLKGVTVENHIFVADKAEWDDISAQGKQHAGFFPVYE